MLIRALGPLEVEADDGPIAIEAPKERTLLAVLLVEANRSVPAGRLIDELWGEDPPRSASKTLQTYVSHLRRFLRDRLVTDPVGYRLRVDVDEFDVHRFERLVSEGRLALLRGEHAPTGRLLSDALALWRGDAYGGVRSESVVQAARVRLEEMRSSVTEDLIDSRLASGEQAALVPELEALVAKYPERERLWGLLMVALDRCGRQADALRAFQRARTHLVDDIGIEPGPDLRAVERSILRQEPADTTQAAGPSATYVGNDDGLKIAYWVTGAGSRDVVFCAEVFFNLELAPDIDELWAFLEPLTRAARLIAVQRRGTGLSDRDPASLLAPPHECTGDIEAVLDAVGSQSVSLVGWGHGGQVALAYAAARPDRVEKVVVVNSYARLSAAPGYAPGLPTQILAAFSDEVERIWGTHRPLEPIFDPRAASDPDVIRRVSRFERLVATPREAGELVRALNDFDIRPSLPAVRCPVLVAFLAGSLTGSANARWLVEHLPSAEYVEAPGYFMPSVADAATLADLVNQFLES